MTDVALISTLTWRSLEMQRDAYPDMPHFVAPDEIPTMLRPTQRNGGLKIHCLSLAIIADNKDDFISFMRSLPHTAEVIPKENDGVFGRRTPIKKAIVCWQAAKKFGAAKAGGEAKAARDEKKFWEKFNKISDRWHLPAKKPNTNEELLAEAEIGSRNTVKSHLGYTREEWQKLTPAKRERILKREAAKQVAA